MFISDCNKCNLCETRNNIVAGEGNMEARIMFIGEAPGQNEDREGRPFVGAAGSNLDKGLASINLRREDIYITNIVKCRPPDNRNPKPKEVDACFPYLEGQILYICPDILVTLGKCATVTMLGQSISMKRAVDSLFHMPIDNRVFLIKPFYHPASIIYNNAIKETYFKSFKELKEIM